MLTRRFPVRPLMTMRPLIAAAEAFPALEDLVRRARSSVWLGFRVFDPTTRLRATPGLAEGTWLDLLAQKLRDGVEIRLLLADFDVLGRQDLHRATWESIRSLEKIAYLGRLEVLPALHLARMKGLGRLTAWLPAAAMTERQRQRLNAMPEGERLDAFASLPGLWRSLRVRHDGRIVWRAARLPRLTPATLHQKIAVADHEHAVIGGIDVDERRYDDPDHRRPAEETWHDVSVAVDGPIATDIARHFAEIWESVRPAMTRLRARQWRRAPAGAQPPPPAPSPCPIPDLAQATATGGGLRLLRTVSEPKPGFLGPLFPVTVIDEIERAHMDLISTARDLVYVETQFFRSRAMAEALVQAARKNPTLGLVLVLPAAPEDVAFEGRSGPAEALGDHLQSECLLTVRSAFGARAAILSPARRVAATRRRDLPGRAVVAGAEPIYVHAKVLICDGTAALVSSANLNGRSLRWDTEAGILCDVPRIVEEMRAGLFRHWLPGDASEAAFDPKRLVPVWNDIARSDAGRAPIERRGLLLPHDHRPAMRDGHDIPGVPQEFV